MKNNVSLLDRLENYAKTFANKILESRHDLEDIYYAVHIASSGKCGIIVYFTPKALTYISLRYGDVSTLLKYVACGIAYVITTFVEYTRINRLENFEEKLLFAIFLRNILRKLHNMLKSDYSRVFNDKNLALVLLRTGYVDDTYVIDLLLDMSHDFYRSQGYDYVELDCSTYWDIVYAVTDAIRQVREVIAEAYVFGRECGLDIDIAVRFTVNERDVIWRKYMRKIVSELVRKYGKNKGMCRILIGRLDMFIYSRDEEDKFLVEARKSGISLISSTVAEST